MIQRRVILTSLLLIIVSILGQCSAQASNMTDFMNQFRMNFANYAAFPIPSTTAAPTSSPSTSTTTSNPFLPPPFMPSYAVAPAGPYPPPFNSPMQFGRDPFPMNPFAPPSLPQPQPPQQFTPSSLSPSPSTPNPSQSTSSNNTPLLFSLESAKNSKSENKVGEVGRGPIEYYNLMAMQKGRAFPVDEFEELYGQGSEMDAGPMNSYGSGSMGAQPSPYGFPNTAAQSQYPSMSPYGGQPSAMPGQMPGGGMFPSASSMSPVGYGGYGSAAFSGGGGSFGGYGGGGGSFGFPGMGGGINSLTSGLGSAGFGGLSGMGGGYGGLLGSATQSLGNILSPLMGGQTRLSFGGGGGGGGYPFGMG